MDTVVAHTVRKDESLKNPMKYGHQLAKPLLMSSRFAGRYFPKVWDRRAIDMHATRVGSRDVLQAYVKQANMESYHGSALVKAEIDKEVTDAGLFIPTDGGKGPLTLAASNADALALRAAVEKHANGHAYGVVHENTLTSQALDPNQGPVGGRIGENSFLKARNAFDTSIVIDTPHGPFSVNDLRDFNIDRILPAYDRRVNGDVAIMGSTGKTVGQLEAHMLAVKEASAAERDAMDQSLRILTGRGRRDTPEDALAHVGRALMSNAYFLKNFAMGFQNFTEVAGLRSRGYLHMLGHNIPGFKDLIAGKYHMTPEGLHDLQAGMFGRELDDSIAPSRMDIAEALREQGSNNVVANTVGAYRWASEAAARHSPWSKLVPGTSNYLLDGARKGILGDIVRHTMAGGKSPMDRLLISEPALLRSASITPGQWEGIKDLLRSSLVRDADGKYSVKDMSALQLDPRSHDLYRLADRLADEVIIRPHKVSNLDTKAYGVGVKMAMQFKSFLVKSLNGRFMRGINEARFNDRAMDQTLTAAHSVLLGGSFYAGKAYLNAQMMPESNRKQYLKEALDPAMIAYAALTRSSYLGTPFGLLNIPLGMAGNDMATKVRTSILPESRRKKDPTERAWLYGLSDANGIGDVAKATLKQIPVAGLISSAAQVGYGLAGLAGNADSPSMAQQHRTGIFNGFRGLMPNDPASQRLTVEMFEKWGIDTSR